jgi:hypothetical protein
MTSVGGKPASLTMRIASSSGSDAKLAWEAFGEAAQVGSDELAILLSILLPP